MSWWLAAPRPELSQGDIVRLAPFGYVQHNLRLLAPGPQGRGGQPTWLSRELHPVGHLAKPEHMLAQGKTLPSLVLTHSCELDKQLKRSSTQRVLVAPVFAVDTLAGPDGEKVRAQLRISSAYLPGLPGLGDCYADFRMMMPVQREFMRGEVLASLTDEAVELLQARLAVYFTRRSLAPGAEAAAQDE